MKIVKLNNTHTLFHKGCTVALRFNSPWSPGAMQCRKALANMDNTKWFTFNSGHRRPYWIGFKDEKLMTWLLLVKDN